MNEPMTAEQRTELVWLMIQMEMVGKWAERAELIRSVVPGWGGGSDLGNLSCRQAGDLLLALCDQAKARTDA